MGFEKGDVELIRKWRESPLEFVNFMWGDVITFTRQQIGALEELGNLIRSKLMKAVGKELTKEDEILSSKIGLSVMSGNGTGKDLFAAACIIYFTFCFPYPKNSATANTGKQLRNVLWAEIAKLLRLARKRTPDARETILQEVMELQKEKLFVREAQGSEWFTEAVTVDTKKTEEEQAEAIAGRHEDYQLFVVDEASGIANAVFHKIERTLTRKLNLLLIIFNPTRSKGYAIDSQTDTRFISLRWSAEDSELVTPVHIEEMEKKYGRDSNSFRISVLGLPPLTDETTLIPYEWIMDAVERDITPLESDPVVQGLDCGAGGDKSILATRKGCKVFAMKKNNTNDSQQLVNWAQNDALNSKADILRVDSIGIGWNVYGELKARMGSIVESADSRRTADQHERFFNKRAEMYWTLREKFEKGLISIPDDSDLILQLGAIKATYEKGKTKIIEKKFIKREIGHSPDEADALALTYYYSNDAMIQSSYFRNRSRPVLEPKYIPQVEGVW